MATVAIAASKAVKLTGQIQAIAPLDTMGLQREIWWATTLLRKNATLIGKFVALRNNYCLALSKGLYDEAEAYLDEVDRECGLSLWVVENRISLSALAGGFERQKACVNKLTSADRRNFVAFFASNIGERNESRVSKVSFETRLKERAKTWKIKSDQKAYIFFKLIGAASLSSIDAADILSFEAASSPIDLYETFLEVLVITKNDLHRTKKQVLSQLLTLHNISDHCLDNLRLLYSDDLPISFDTAGYLNAFLTGNYPKAAFLVEDGLQKRPDDPLLILVAAKLQVLGYTPVVSENPFVGHLLSLLGSFFEQSKGSSEAEQSLERLALNFRSLPISSVINGLVRTACADIIGEIPQETALRSRYSSLPILLPLMEETRIQALLNDNSAIQDDVWNYERIAHCGPTDAGRNLSSEAQSYAVLSRSRRIGTPSQALPCLDDLSNSEHAYFRQESSILRAWFLLETGDIQGSILHAVKNAISKPTLLRSMPIVELFEHRGYRELKQLEREPCLSIGFFLYTTLTRESTKDVALKVAWKQFHKAHKTVKPSELTKKVLEFDREEILFFLRNVCTQEIMELSAAFNSPGDLDRERLQVCIALSELDTEHSSDYDSEIIELTRRLSIEDGVQQIESSRVYVDLLGLQRHCHQSLGELFLRYMDYAVAGLEASNDELERSILVIVKKTGADAAFLSFLDAYDISADSLLAELIEECANHFLNLPRFGLDAFLGSRVRHGSLEGAFRSPLEARKLITKIDSTTNQYESNTYWLTANGTLNEEQVSALNKVLNGFSASIDNLLDNAISRFIHVRNSQYPEGLIWLWPSGEKRRHHQLATWLIQAKANLSKEVTVDQFVEFCATDLFWPNLKPSLVEAAEFVTITLCRQILENLDLLATAVRRITPCQNGLTACIGAAKGDIEMAAGKVSRWFAPPQFTDFGSSYLLRTGIEIGLTSLRHLRPQFTSEIQWDIDNRANVLLHSAGFQTINDVAFLIFGNILKHSGFFDGYSNGEHRPGIKIWLRWIDPNLVEVEVQNEIHHAKDIASIEANVNSAKEQIRLRQFDAVARQKNKTGLVRLASVLNYENTDDKIVDFGIVDNSRFRVKFSVPVFLLTGEYK